MIYQPPNQYFEGHEGELICLTGPISSNLDWCSKAIELINIGNPDLHIASPISTVNGPDYDYAKQTSWAIYHSRCASATGAIMFWFEDDRYLDGRENGQESWWEASEWIANMKYRRIFQPERESLKLIIGIASGFSGERYMRFRLGDDLPHFPIYSTLEDTCAGILEIFKENK